MLSCGYPNAQFRVRLQEAIKDAGNRKWHRLWYHRPNVYYTYAARRLKTLPLAQRQMIRLGPDNQKRLKHSIKKHINWCWLSLNASLALLLRASLPRRHSNQGKNFGLWFLKLLGGWSIQGEVPAHQKMVIAVAPHTLDQIFSRYSRSFGSDINIRFLGKHSIFVWPVKGLLTALGGIPVDRRHAHGVVGRWLLSSNKAMRCSWGYRLRAVERK